MKDLHKIGKVAKYLGISRDTLRRWEEEGKLIPFYRSDKISGGTRYYSPAQLRNIQVGRHWAGKRSANRVKPKSRWSSFLFWK